MASDLRSSIRHAAVQAIRRAPAPVQNGLRQGSRRILAALGESDVTPSPRPFLRRRVGASGPVWVSPDVPLPEGLTLEQVETAMTSWSLDGGAPGHMTDYVNDSICRFLHTWSLARDDYGRCLELGANPYFTTYLLVEHTELDLTLANYFGHSGEMTQTVSYVPPGARERVETKYPCAMFNVEEDEFPFPDGSFRLVLFCEMLEHLLMNPLATLAQIHRVLEPDGILVLTTPNVVRIGNASAIIDGSNIYDPYSGFGPYGRHNREYTITELQRLLRFAGFTIERSFTADGHPSDPTTLPRYRDVAPLLRSRTDLGHYLFIRARKVAAPRAGFPEFLFRSYPADQMVRDAESPVR